MLKHKNAKNSVQCVKGWEYQKLLHSDQESVCQKEGKRGNAKFATQCVQNEKLKSKRIIFMFLWYRGGRGVGGCVVEQTVKVNIVHTLKKIQLKKYDTLKKQLSLGLCCWTYSQSGHCPYTKKNIHFHTHWKKLILISCC